MKIIKGYILIGKEKISNGPYMWSESKKECTDKCKGGCKCDPSMFYVPVFLEKKEAKRHQDLMSKIIPVSIIKELK